MGLREQAKLDARAILEDSSGFAWPVTLTSPLGVATYVNGFTTDIGQSIDPETGQAVAGRRASVSVARAALPVLPEAVADGSRKPWVATFFDSQGLPGTWKVIEVLPDLALGVVVLLLEVYQRAIVPFASSALTLPARELDGTVTPELALAGALALSSRTLDGTVSPAVALAGALAVPSGRLLAGGVAPLPVLAGALALPSLQVAGALTPAVALAGAPTLPSLRLSGAYTMAIQGSIVMPSLQLSGAYTMAIQGSIVMPSLQLSGTLTPGATKMIGWIRLASSTQSGGEWTSLIDILNAGSPLAQTDVDRRAAVSAAPNGQPTATLDGTDMYPWPPSPAVSATTKLGIWLWVKFSAAAITPGGPIFVHFNGAGGATLSRLILNLNNGGTTTNLQINCYISNANGRSFGTPFNGITFGIWYAIYLQYDSSRGGDANLAIYINGNLITLNPINIGAGGTLGALQASTGNALLGAIADSDAPASALGNGTLIGPHGYTFNDNLTAAEIAAYLGYEAPN